MAVPIPGTITRNAGQFFNVQTAGARDLAQALLRAATAVGRDATGPLTAAARQAARPVMEAYKANVNDVTGNLTRSVRINQGKRKYEGVGIAVAGPVHVVNTDEWDVLKKGAGNHAWLLEYGSGPRKPGSQKRRTYLNVHQSINGRMSQVSRQGGRLAFDNEQFERMGRGYYFLMGSINEPQRRTGPGAFVQDGAGGTRPYTLAAGDTYPAMPAKHPMERAIQQSAPAALETLRKAINAQISKITR